MLFDNIEYPDDKSLRTKLDAIPKFKSFMMNTICALREKYIAVEFVGNGNAESVGVHMREKKWRNRLGYE